MDTKPEYEPHDDGGRRWVPTGALVGFVVCIAWLCLASEQYPRPHPLYRTTVEQLRTQASVVFWCMMLGMAGGVAISLARNGWPATEFQTGWRSLLLVASVVLAFVVVCVLYYWTQLS